MFLNLLFVCYVNMFCELALRVLREHVFELALRVLREHIL